MADPNNGIPQLNNNQHRVVGTATNVARPTTTPSSFGAENANAQGPSQGNPNQHQHQYHQGKLGLLPCSKNRQGRRQRTPSSRDSWKTPGSVQSCARSVYHRSAQKHLNKTKSKWQSIHQVQQCTNRISRTCNCCSNNTTRRLQVLGKITG